MGLGFDYDELKRHWDGAKQAYKGDAIYDPRSGDYVPIAPAQLPTADGDGPIGSAPGGLGAAGPNSTEARLAHAQMLVATGAITADEGAELRRRILQGL